jgi:hypothetical protein
MIDEKLYLYNSIKQCLREYLIGPFGHPELIVNERKKYAFLVNSKAACTSIKESIIKDIGYRGSIGNPHHFNFKKGERVFKNTDLSEYFVFMVVREPIKRLESLYTNKFRDFEKITKQGFYFQDYLGGIFSLNDDYNTFLKKICSISDKRADRHFISQSALKKNVEKRFNCLVKTYKLESLKSLEDELSIKFNFDVKFPKKNSSTDVEIIKSNHEQLALIRKHFKEDFECFNY